MWKLNLLFMNVLVAQCSSMLASWCKCFFTFDRWGEWRICFESRWLWATTGPWDADNGRRKEDVSFISFVYCVGSNTINIQYFHWSFFFFLFRICSPFLKDRLCPIGNIFIKQSKKTKQKTGAMNIPCSPVSFNVNVDDFTFPCAHMAC